MLYIFNQSEVLIDILSNESIDDPIILNDNFKRQVNQEWSYTFDININKLTEQNIKVKNKVGFYDENDNFQLFTIEKIEDNFGDKDIKSVTCYHDFYSMVNKIIENLDMPNATISSALTSILQGTNYQIGNVTNLGNRDVFINYMSSLEALNDLLITFGGEVGYRLTLNANKTGIGNRYVDIGRLGTDTGIRFSFDLNIAEIKRTVDTVNLFNVLYGRGKAQDTEDSLGNRKLTFANVVWTTPTSPTNKPLGKTYVEDTTSIAKWGRLEGVYHADSIEDASVLLQNTWDKLQEMKEPLMSYEVSIVDLARITGYEHLKVTLGDTIFIYDTDYDINLEARIIEENYSIFNPQAKGIVLGNFLKGYTDNNTTENLSSRIDIIEEDLKNGSVVIGDSSYPNTLPTVPTVTATGLFATVQLSWTFDNKPYYEYEVYASKVLNFTPDSSNLIYKGKASAYLHYVKPSETWYYKVRAKNIYGNATAYSTQVSATTLKITDGTQYIENLAIKDALIETLRLDRAWLGQLDATYLNVKGKLSVLDGNSAKTLEIDSFGNVTINATSLKVASKNVANIDDINNIKVGGRNLARGTETNYFLKYSNGVITFTDGIDTKIIKATRTILGSTFGLLQNNPYRIMKLQVGKQYTLSFEARGIVGLSLNYIYMMNTVGGNQAIFSGYDTIIDSATVFKKFSMTFTQNIDSPYSYVMISSAQGVVNDWFEVQNIKVEEGNKATTWTQAPEDVIQKMNDESLKNISMGSYLSSELQVNATKYIVELKNQVVTPDYDNYYMSIKDKATDTYWNGVTLPDVTVMQSFAYGSISATMYTAQLKSGDNNSLIIGKSGSKMTLTGFGHGTNIGIENNTVEYLWVEARGVVDTDGKTYGTRICRLPFVANATYTTTSGTEYNLVPNHTNLSPTVDNTYRRLGIRSKYNGEAYYTIFDLDSVISGTPKQLAQFKLPSLLQTSTNQGHNVYGKYVYHYEGNSISDGNGNNTYVTVLDFKGNIIDRNLVNVGSGLSFREPEGIQLLTFNNKKDCYLYVGFADGVTGSRKAYIYRYIDILPSPYELDGSFIHPNGYKEAVNLTNSGKYVYTDLVGGGGNKRYLMYIGSDPTRFTYNKNASESKQFICASYSNGKWYRHEYTDALVEFTPNANDCLIAELKESYNTTEGIATITQLSLKPKTIFDMLTDNGNVQGLFMRDNKLYINAEHLQGQLLRGVEIQTSKNPTSFDGYMQLIQDDLFAYRDNKRMIELGILSDPRGPAYCHPRMILGNKNGIVYNGEGISEDFMIRKVPDVVSNSGLTYSEIVHYYNENGNQNSSFIQFYDNGSIYVDSEKFFTINTGIFGIQKDGQLSSPYYICIGPSSKFNYLNNPGTAYGMLELSSGLIYASDSVGNFHFMRKSDSQYADLNASRLVQKGIITPPLSAEIGDIPLLYAEGESLPEIPITTPIDAEEEYVEDIIEAMKNTKVVKRNGVLTLNKNRTKEDTKKLKKEKKKDILEDIFVVDEEDVDGIEGIDLTAMIHMMWKVCKEQQIKIEELESKIK